MSKRSLPKRMLLALLGITGPVLLQAQCVQTDEAQDMLSAGFNSIFLDFVNARSQDFFNQFFGVDD